MLKSKLKQFERIHGGERNIPVRRFVNFCLKGGGDDPVEKVKNILDGNVRDEGDALRILKEAMSNENPETQKEFLARIPPEVADELRAMMKGGAGRMKGGVNLKKILKAAAVALAMFGLKPTMVRSPGDTYSRSLDEIADGIMDQHHPERVPREFDRIIYNDEFLNSSPAMKEKIRPKIIESLLLSPLSYLEENYKVDGVDRTMGELLEVDGQELTADQIEKVVKEIRIAIKKLTDKMKRMGFRPMKWMTEPPVQELLIYRLQRKMESLDKSAPPRALFSRRWAESRGRAKLM